MRTLPLTALLVLGACTFDGHGPDDLEDPVVDPDPDPMPDPMPPSSIDALLLEWSGCMSLDNFVIANMAPAWSSLTTAANTKCTACHTDPRFTDSLGGFIASSDPELFFRVISEHSYFMLLYFAVDVAANKVIPNDQTFETIAASQGVHAAHPSFDLNETGALTALQSFYDLTVARKAAGQCDPPRLID